MQHDHSTLTLTITIVNTNNRELLRTCLETITRTVRKTTYEIIVVNNACDDRSAEMMAENYPDVQIINNTTRQGYGSSHNRAIQAARGVYLLILNEDMEILDDAIDTMVAQAAELQNLGALGCRILSPDRSLQHSCFKFPTLGQELFEAIFPRTLILSEARIRSKMYYWSHDSDRDVDIVVGCCMLVPRSVIERIGGFDPAFFVYSEEHDWCKRMRDAGLRVVFTPKAQMIHVGGQTSKRMSLKMAMVQLDSRTKFFQKHHGTFQASLFRVIVAVGAAVRGVGWGARLLLRGRSDENTVDKLTEYIESVKFVATWKH